MELNEMNATRETLEQTLPFDQYSRQQIVSSLIDRSLRPLSNKNKLNIIDLGGHKGKTAEFQPNDNVTILDVFDENYKNYVKGDATKTSFKAEAFDVACSFDVFEHIPRKKRQAFVNEALRISKYGVFLAMPVDVDNKVASAEIMLNNFHKTLFATDHRWLKEHIDYKIPNEQEVKQLAQNSGADCLSLSSNQIGDWQLLQMLIFSAANNPDITEDVNAINAWYNKNIESLDSGVDVGYRQIFFISKHEDSIRSVKHVVDAIAKKESKDYVTVNRATLDEFAGTLSRINKKYIDQLALFNKTAQTKKQLLDELKLLTENFNNFKDHNVKLTAELSRIYSSPSWKLTKPLRVVAKVRRKLGKTSQL